MYSLQGVLKLCHCVCMHFHRQHSPPSMQKGMNVIAHSVDVKHTLEIPAKTIKLEGTKGEEVELIPPSGTLGYKPIPLLLLSHKWREGQQPVSLYDLYSVIIILVSIIRLTMLCYCSYRPFPLLDRQSKYLNNKSCLYCQ